jgi:hypothetical protein
MYALVDSLPLEFYTNNVWLIIEQARPEVIVHHRRFLYQIP